MKTKKMWYWLCNSLGHQWEVIEETEHLTTTFNKNNISEVEWVETKKLLHCPRCRRLHCKSEWVYVSFKPKNKQRDTQK